MIATLIFINGKRRPVSIHCVGSKHKSNCWASSKENHVLQKMAQVDVSDSVCLFGHLDGLLLRTSKFSIPGLTASSGTIIFSVPHESENGSCYFRLPIRTRYSWNHAKYKCTSFGNDSYIAVPNDCDELLKIHELMLYDSSDTSEYFWLGCEEYDEDPGILSCFDNSKSYWNISSASGSGYWRKYLCITLA